MVDILLCLSFLAILIANLGKGNTAFAKRINPGANTRGRGGSIAVTTKATLGIKVKRGPESWAYIYVALGFALTIEGTIIQMTPLVFPLNLVTYFVSAAITVWLFIYNGWFQNKLIGVKNRYENRAH